MENDQSEVTSNFPDDKSLLTVNTYESLQETTNAIHKYYSLTFKKDYFTEHAVPVRCHLTQKSKSF